jgi:tetratricopeptide (TPR) repeat protein
MARMAKSKKPDSGKITPFQASHAAPPKDFVREKEQMLRLIQEKLSTSDMSGEETDAFLSSLQGQKMEDIIAGLGGAPQTDLDRANDIIWDMPEDASDAAMKKAAKKALAISEDCMGAWLILSELAKTDEEAIDLLNQGIARGRQLHAGLIASVGEDHGLWGHVEARDFMRLLHELANAHEGLGNLEAAVKTYEEMLRLNPGDNQGVRGDLLHQFIILGQPTKAKALLKRYRISLDCDTDMAYGKALLDILVSLPKLKENWAEELSRYQPSDTAGFRKFLGPAFPAVDKALKAAFRTNPYVAILMGLPGIMDLNPPDALSIGGPDEAVEYIQKHGHIWVIAYLPFVLMAAYGPTVATTLAEPTPRQAEELDFILQVANRPNHKPWWEELMEKNAD